MITAPYIDVEQLLVAWVPTVVQVACSADLPANAETRLPIVQVQRIGGTSGVPYDLPTVDLDCYAPDLVSANALAGALQTAVIYRLPGHMTAGAVVSASEVISGPGRRPNENQNMRCVGVTVRLSVKPR